MFVMIKKNNNLCKHKFNLVNKHGSEILQETLLNSVSMICFPLWLDKVMIVLHC
jgi:hypothetical protein